MAAATLNNIIKETNSDFNYDTFVGTEKDFVDAFKKSAWRNINNFTAPFFSSAPEVTIINYIKMSKAETNPTIEKAAKQFFKESPENEMDKQENEPFMKEFEEEIRQERSAQIRQRQTASAPPIVIEKQSASNKVAEKRSASAPAPALVPAAQTIKDCNGNTVILPIAVPAFLPGKNRE